jgi:hypothetical protein
MKKLIIVGIILIILVGIGAYIFEMNSSGKNSLISVATTTSESATGWKTFVNQKYGYSIQYPPEYFAPISQGGANNYLINFYKSKFITREGAILSSADPIFNRKGISDAPLFSVEVVPMNTDLGVTRSGKNLREWVKNNFQDANFRTPIMEDPKALVVNGRNGFYFKGTCTMGPCVYEGVTIEDGGNIYLIENSYGSTLENNKVYNDLDRLSFEDFMKIVQSLKLLK